MGKPRPVLRGRTAACTVIALALVATPSRAEPPDLDTGGFERGEIELEANAWLRRSQSTVRPELELGLADGLGLELQMGFEHQPGAWRLDAVSAQLSRDLTRRGTFGLAFELGIQPSHDELQAEAFAYGSRDLGPWRIDLNAGLEREDGSSAAAYAGRVVRRIDDNVSLGLEAGGRVDLKTGREEHLFGPVLRWRSGDDRPEITLGVSRESGAHYSLRLGIEQPL